MSLKNVFSRHFRGMSDPTLRIGYLFSSKKMKKMKPIMDQFEDGVEFVQIDVKLPVEEQGRLDGILHKLSHDIVLQSQDDEASSRLAWLEEVEAKHPEIVIIDPISVVRRSVCRLQLHNALLRLGDDSCPEGTQRLTIPKSVSVVGNTPTMVSAMEDAEFDYPVICKPLDSCGKTGS